MRNVETNCLYIAILSNLTIAQEIIRISNLKIEEDKERYLHYSPLRFETTLITSLLPEIYSIVYRDGEMVESLFRLKLQLSTLNSTLDIFQSLNPTEMEYQLETHSKHMKKNLESRFGLINPLQGSSFKIFTSN